MEAIEFKAKIKGGTIQIPQKYQQKIGDRVKVIILSETRSQETDIIDKLLKNPLKIDNFSPLSRDEIYERS